jgi:hypothetical protein
MSCWQTVTHLLENPVQRWRKRSMHELSEVAAGKDSRLAAAFVLSVGGSSLTWAQALSIVDLLPMWSTILACVWTGHHTSLRMRQRS